MAIKNGIPEGYSTITPHLIVKGAAKAIEFYGKAFGAEEIYRLPMPDGTIAHADLRIGSSLLWLADENPQMGNMAPAGPGSNAASVVLHVADADKVFARAVAAGAEVVQPVTEMFWGARFGQLRDPFGHKWSIATQVREVSPAEIVEAMKRMAQGK